LKKKTHPSYYFIIISIILCSHLYLSVLLQLTDYVILFNLLFTCSLQLFITEEFEELKNFCTCNLCTFSTSFSTANTTTSSISIADTCSDNNQTFSSSQVKMNKSQKRLRELFEEKNDVSKNLQPIKRIKNVICHKNVKLDQKIIISTNRSSLSSSSTSELNKNKKRSINELLNDQEKNIGQKHNIKRICILNKFEKENLSNNKNENKMIDDKFNHEDYISSIYKYLDIKNIISCKSLNKFTEKTINFSKNKNYGWMKKIRERDIGSLEQFELFFNELKINEIIDEKNISKKTFIQLFYELSFEKENIFKQLRISSSFKMNFFSYLLQKWIKETPNYKKILKELNSTICRFAMFGSIKIFLLLIETIQINEINDYDNLLMKDFIGSIFYNAIIDLIPFLLKVIKHFHTNKKDFTKIPMIHSMLNLLWPKELAPKSWNYPSICWKNYPLFEQRLKMLKSLSENDLFCEYFVRFCNKKYLDPFKELHLNDLKYKKNMKTHIFI